MMAKCCKCNKNVSDTDSMGFTPEQIQKACYKIEHLAGVRLNYPYGCICKTCWKKLIDKVDYWQVWNSSTHRLLG